MKALLTIMLSTVLSFPLSAEAIDCTLLDPRGKITKEAETKVAGGLSGLFQRLVNIKGDFHRKVKNTVDNLHGQLPKTDKQIIKEKLIYLYCEAMNEQGIEQQVQFLNSLQNALELPLTGGSEHIETKQDTLSTIGIASISWQCRKTEKDANDCPPEAELKRRAIYVAQITAAAALARQLHMRLDTRATVKGGTQMEEEMEERIGKVLRGIRYGTPVETGDQLSIPVHLPVHLNVEAGDVNH